MNNLFPEGYESELPTITADEAANLPIGYKQGIAFNYNEGDFLKNGKNDIKESTGIESWKSWIMNCLQTERYKHLAYPTDFGIEMDAIFSAPSRDVAESILVKQVNDAILADPYRRATFVEIYNIKWDGPDAISLAMIIHGIEDVTIDVETHITRR